MAVKAYEEVLQVDLPSDIRILVERQLVEIRQAHDHIRSLEQAHARRS